jgi:hypothetical protein
VVFIDSETHIASHHYSGVVDVIIAIAIHPAALYDAVLYLKLFALDDWDRFRLRLWYWLARRLWRRLPQSIFCAHSYSRGV